LKKAGVSYRNLNTMGKNLNPVSKKAWKRAGGDTSDYIGGDVGGSNGGGSNVGVGVEVGGWVDTGFVDREGRTTAPNREVPALDLEIEEEITAAAEVAAAAAEVEISRDNTEDTVADIQEESSAPAIEWDLTEDTEDTQDIQITITQGNGTEPPPCSCLYLGIGLLGLLLIFGARPSKIPAKV
jgi:hypothetical protein